ncbi:hypothetical protein CGGC5_v017245 [Colletotrichum fructicola Nara gc5]|uniref:Ankyrin repeat protein n=1 Tax=Colletotrichum fructicola (strain Nara gc5) TaxID=1213859 RepID=A0A7J6ICG8_COLFN|nr:hypothetical protein CGGC5_v017245 [Colletotrichum fructicola Nara gc5]KAF4881158.1 hypothetical protein CGCFRS4_v015839 [Colletotrichum fructicola]
MYYVIPLPHEILRLIALGLNTIEDRINLSPVYHTDTPIRTLIEGEIEGEIDGRALFAAIITGDTTLLELAVDYTKRNHPDKLDVTLPPYWGQLREEGDPPPPVMLAGLQNIIPWIDDYTALQVAIVVGNKRFVKRLLEEGADVALRSPGPCWSCDDLDDPGHPPHFNPDFDAPNAAKTPIHTAICYGQSKIVERLIKAGASGIVSDGDSPQPQ